MNKFHSIDFPQILHESLRDYFTINKAGNLSFLYRFLLCVIWPFKLVWDTFETYRAKIWLISQTKWQLGQLTNVLNYLYDSINNSIYITQSVIDFIFAPVFAETTTIFAPVFAETTDFFAPTFSDILAFHPVIIHIPASLLADTSSYSDMVATIEKIRILGLSYSIETF